MIWNVFSSISNLKWLCSQTAHDPSKGLRSQKTGIPISLALAPGYIGDENFA
jgi:hypothetical protein